MQRKFDSILAILNDIICILNCYSSFRHFGIIQIIYKYIGMLNVNTVYYYSNIKCTVVLLISLN